MHLDVSFILIIDDNSSKIVNYSFVEKNYFSNLENCNINPVEHLSELDKTPFLIIINNDSKCHSTLRICEEIKAHKHYKDIDILIIGSTITPELKSQCRKAGAYDILTGDINQDDFEFSIQRSQQNYERILQLTIKSEKAKYAAKEAIYDIGDQASVIHFLQNSFKCSSIDQLTDLIVSTASEFGLLNTVQLTTPVCIYSKSSAGKASARDVEMMRALKDLGRVYQLGRRLILNFGPISQLIKNLPDKDEEKCGRLRDNLALILEGSLNRLNALFFLEEMKSLFEEINTTVKKTKEKQSANKKKNLEIMEEMYDEIQLGLSYYGLTEDQEIALMSTVDRYSERIFCTYEEGMKADQQLEQIALKINTSLAHFAEDNH